LLYQLELAFPYSKNNDDENFSINDKIEEIEKNKFYKK